LIKSIRLFSLPIDPKTQKVRPGFIEYTYVEKAKKTKEDQPVKEEQPHLWADIGEGWSLARFVVTFVAATTLTSAAAAVAKAQALQAAANAAALQAQAAKAAAEEEAAQAQAAAEEEAAQAQAAAEEAAQAQAARAAAATQGWFSRLGSSLNNFIIVPGFLFDREGSGEIN
jgi:regulator of protease activity HflC (stomatin/prohibitin superfamily)